MAQRKVKKSHRPLVGVIVDRSSSHGRSILRGVARYAALERRWRLFAETEWLFNETSPSFLDGEMLPALDGAIFSAMPAAIIDYGLARSPFNVFCVGGAKDAGWPVVYVDYIATGRQAAEHLMELRLEHFAYYWDVAYKVSRHRFDGFRSALTERGFECLTCPLTPPTPEQRLSRVHRAGVIQWLRGLPKPIGIMAYDDYWANDLAEACFEADISVPDQVAIVGVNNDDLVCEIATPPLSSVNVEFSRVGYAAAGLLDRMLSGHVLNEAERRIVLPPLGVVQRQSSNALAIRDASLVEAIRFIREHACDPCSVSDVLDEVAVGRRWLERKFTSELGRSPHEEIARVRLEAARRMLLHSDLSVYDIAAKCGFASDTSFRRFFESAAGMAPAAFRKRNTKPSNHKKP